MNTMKRHDKIHPKVCESLHHQFNMYALAAGAAGVGLLALAQPAEAKIVYTPTHHVIGKNGRYKLDLNHDKITDITLVDTYGCNTDYCYGRLSAIPAGGNGVEGKRGFLSIPYAYALKHGALVGPKQPFSGQLMPVTTWALSGSGSTSATVTLVLSSRSKEKPITVGHDSLSPIRM